MKISSKPLVCLLLVIIVGQLTPFRAAPLLAQETPATEVDTSAAEDAEEAAAGQITYLFLPVMAADSTLTATEAMFPVISAPSNCHDHGDGQLHCEREGSHERQDDAFLSSAEEASLLERVEREGLGVNPNVVQAAGLEHLQGRWEGPYAWPVVGIFVSLLPNGKVLAYDSVGDNPAESYQVHNFTRATLWDPVANTHTGVNSNTGYNLFCSGFATLPDGRLFIAGGNKDSALNGINKTHLFDFNNNSWLLEGTMSYERWYPSVTPLAAGEMLITGGGPATSEVRQSNAGLRLLSGATQSVWANFDYPWLQAAPNGRAAYFGPAATVGYVDTNGSGSWQQVATRSDNSYRSYGSYAMYDLGRVLVSGGATFNSSANLVNLNNNSSSATNSMAYQRRQHNLTILADGTVLATGGFGNSSQGLVDLANAVYAAERWNPATGQWTTLASMNRARMYHSTALLLPDGRVLSAGGGICGICQSTGYLQKNAEIFSPPYLFKQDGSGQLASRPSISAAPTQVNYGQSFSVSTPQASAIAKVSFIRLGAVTHSVNMSQRYLSLAYTVGSGALQVTAPANANMAPPGHYLLFLIDNSGVPSVAQIVQINNATGGVTGVRDLVNVHSNKCLDVPGGSTTNNLQLIQWTCHGGNNQKWNITQVGSYYRLTNVATGKVLSVASSSTQAGAQVVQRTWLNYMSQQWQIRQAGAGYELVNRRSGLCADVTGASLNDGASTIQWGCNGGNNQKWMIR